MTSRRTFLATFAGGILGVSLAAEAQQAGKIYRLGLLFSVLPPTFPDRWAFYERMRQLGWVYNQTFAAEHRVYGGQYERIPDLAAELIRAGVDIFVVQGGIDAARVQQATRTIPIVTTTAGDLVAMGLAVSLTRPGGNVTGIQTLQPQLVAKQLSLLKEAIPRLSRAGVLIRGSSPALREAIRHEVEAGGKSLGVALQTVTFQELDELERAFSAFRSEQAQGLVVVRDAFWGAHTKTLVNLASRDRLPTISDIPNLAAQGGFMSYHYNVSDAARSAADIVDKILRGANAGEIPIQQATTFQFSINLKTAKALGLTIPQTLLLRADQVIE